MRTMHSAEFGRGTPQAAATFSLIAWSIVASAGLLNAQPISGQPRQPPAGVRGADTAERLRSVAQITDQAALAKIALQDENFAVRSMAVSRLTDQALLAKIITEESGNGRGISEEYARDIRRDAVARVTDQSLLVKIALEEPDIGTREIAITGITDQQISARIAMTEKDWRCQRDAIRNVVDKSLLATLVVNRVVDRAMRHFAFFDDDFFTKVDYCCYGPNHREWHVDFGGGAYSEVVAFRQLGLSGVDAEKLAGDLSKVTDDALEAMGRIALLLADPAIAGRMPGITFDWDLRPATQSYNNPASPAPVPWVLTGEQVSFTLMGGLEILAGDMWSTEFPGAISWRAGTLPPSDEGPAGFRPAKVQIRRMIADFLKSTRLPQSDLARLARSKVPEIREAATGRLAELSRARQ